MPQKHQVHGFLGLRSRKKEKGDTRKQTVHELTMPRSDLAAAAAAGRAILEFLRWILAQMRRVQTNTMNMVLTANPITVITKLSPGEIMILPPTIPHFTSPSPSPSKYTATTFHEAVPDQRCRKIASITWTLGGVGDRRGRRGTPLPRNGIIHGDGEGEDEGGGEEAKGIRGGVRKEEAIRGEAKARRSRRRRRSSSTKRNLPRARVYSQPH